MGVIRTKIPNVPPVKPHAPAPAPVHPRPWELLDDQSPPLAIGEVGMNGQPFSAELDVCELDEHGRTSSIWPARAALLSRSHLAILSRRMTFLGRVILVAVHLIDDEATPLMGRVVMCDYHAEGMYKIVIELMKTTDGDAVHRWAKSRGRK